jgi:hypothetical protein
VCFDFLYSFDRDISHSEKNAVRSYYRCTRVFMYSTRYYRCTRVFMYSTRYYRCTRVFMYSTHYYRRTRVFMYSTYYSRNILIKLELFSVDLKINRQISYFLKIHPVGAEMFHADRRTCRRDKANRILFLFYECA